MRLYWQLQMEVWAMRYFRIIGIVENGCFLLKQETAVFASSPSFHFNSFLPVIE